MIIIIILIINSLFCNSVKFKIEVFFYFVFIVFFLKKGSICLQVGVHKRRTFELYKNQLTIKCLLTYLYNNQLQKSHDNNRQLKLLSFNQATRKSVEESEPRHNSLLGKQLQLLKTLQLHTVHDPCLKLTNPVAVMGYTVKVYLYDENFSQYIQYFTFIIVKQFCYYWPFEAPIHEHFVGSINYNFTTN